jgi:glycosyltransferase involved in cell wall biosynthesis
MAANRNTEQQTDGPPQVAILGTLPPLRAISSYCEGLVGGLLALTRVEFVSFAHLYPKALYPGAALEDEDSPAPTHPHLTIRRELSWFNPLSWVRAGLRLQSPVLIVQWWSLPLSPVFITVALVARLRGISVVTTLHNITPHSGRSFWYRVATRLLLGLSHRAIVHSLRNAEQLNDELRFPPPRTLVLPMGAADFRRGRPIDREASRARLDLPHDRPVLLMLGALREYKGLEVALAAMKTVAEREPRALLLVAGQPWGGESGYRDAITRLGLVEQVRLDLNFIAKDAIHDYLAAADMMLLPYTHFDAQSGIGVSALPYGLPLVVSDCGSLPELVSDPASVVEPGDAAGLAERVSAILASAELHRRLATESAALAGKHGWDSIARDLYRQLDAGTAQTQEGETL